MDERKNRSGRVMGLGLKLTFRIVILLSISVLVFGVQVVGLHSHTPLKGLEKGSRLRIGTISARAELELLKGTRLVRLEEDAESTTPRIVDWRKGLARSAAVTVLLGIVGAVVVARMTVTPIRRLAGGMTVIQTTEDKEMLRDYRIKVGTRDEIGWLTEKVNEMAHGLVKAAVANKELLQGINVQKRFLPLLKGHEGREASTAEEENAQLEICGYYMGARGVSGDYFDFKRLDDTHYALIECDVSGKGIPAALIMVEVATLFINYCRSWQKRKESISRLKDPQARQRALKGLERLDSLMCTINDMLEGRGFDGMFAALTMCLYNSASGAVTVCNAGDVMLHIHSSRKKSMVHSSLPATPAAGMFPSVLVNRKSPYSQVVHRLEPGDSLFLYTDGLEISRRKLRNTQCGKFPCNAPELENGEVHLGTHRKGDTEESFGRDRFDGIVNAVFNKEHYRLVRSHNPIADEDLDFDFSTCAGTVKEAVLALVAVERVYRMIPDPPLRTENVVRIESQVAAFMEQHFLQYQRYFSHRREENATSVVTFSDAREDHQYDDIALLVLRRKPDRESSQRLPLTLH